MVRGEMGCKNKNASIYEELRPIVGQFTEQRIIIKGTPYRGMQTID